MQARLFRPGVRVEHEPEDILKDNCRIGRQAINMLQGIEIPVEQFVPVAVDQTGIVMEDSLDAGDRSCSVADKLIDKIQHFLHISQLIFRCGSGNAVADKDQKRLLDLVFVEPCTRCAVKLHLLVEGQQAAGQIQMTLLFVDAAFQVVDPIILAVTVLVEILVGIVHDDGLPVLFH